MVRRLAALGALLMLAASPGDAIAGDPTLVTTLDLWPVTRAPEVGWVSIGLMHERQGDRLILYDMRESRPSVNEPLGNLGLRPEAKDGVYMVSHFRGGNTNRLRGNFNEYHRQGSRADVTLAKDADGQNALRISYDVGPGSYAGAWMHLFETKAHPELRRFVDASDLGFITFKVRGDSGDEPLWFRIADRSWNRKEDSLPMGTVGEFLPEGRITTSWQQAWVPLTRVPERIDRTQLANAVFGIEESARGTVYIRDFAFTEARGDALPAPARPQLPPPPPVRAMWLWETLRVASSPTETAKLRAFCKKHGINRLYVQIPYEAEVREGAWSIEWDPEALRRLIGSLSEAHVEVEALDGDPRYALEKNHGRILATIREINDYNQRVEPYERFVGIRYDIEPYLLKEFAGSGRGPILRQYISLLKQAVPLAHQGGLSFGADIAFWFDARNEFYELVTQVDGRTMTEWMLDLVDNIGIMDYRTSGYGADGAIAHAQGELAYADRMGKKVLVGLETVWLPDETLYEFGANGTGSQLLVQPLPGGRAQVTWLAAGRDPGPLSPGAVLLRQSRVVNVPASKITFHSMKPQRLRRVMREVQLELGSHPSFAGFIIHSYESFAPWISREAD